MRRSGDRFASSPAGEIPAQAAARAAADLFAAAGPTTGSEKAPMSYSLHSFKGFL